MRTQRTRKGLGILLVGGALLALVALVIGGVQLRRSAGAEALLASGQAALEATDIHGAYPLFKQLRTEHPEAEVTRRAWPYATTAFRALWWERRMKRELEADWTKRETAFMYEWLASFYAGDEFPADPTRRLLHNMPTWFLKEFVAQTSQHPAVSRWRIGWEKDNGRITSVTGTLRAVSTASR